jgi:TldD protein
VKRPLRFAALAAILLGLGSAQAARPRPARARAAQAAGQDKDQTLRAMHDEMARSLARLHTADLGKPYFISYRLLDMDVRVVTADFGALVSSAATRNRFMTVDVRMGNYHIDSSNFVTSGGFQGALGSSGEVGIDRDYNSLRQDLWLATDQAYKQAADQLARKQAFLQTLARPPQIDDFSRVEPVVLIEPHAVDDWSGRNWEEEAKETSRVFRSFPQFTSGRVTYYFIYTTYYLLTSEGTELRIPHSFAAVEATAETLAADGMPLHDFYAAYAVRPAELPSADAVRQALERTSQQLVALRSSTPAPDYDGPILFDPQAAGALLAQLLGPAVSGARPPLAMVPVFNEMMERLGGRSEWTGQVGTRVLSPLLTLIDDPTAKEFQGQPLLGGYEVDEEGVRGQRVTIVENGILKNLLMSRRPGPDFSESNGHGRAAGLNNPQPAISNLFFQASQTLAPADLKKKFLDLCRQDGRTWCLEIKRMDNPALATLRQADYSTMLSELAAGAATGDRMPLLVERVYVADGHEEPIRGARLTNVDIRTLRRVAGIGNNPEVFTFLQNPTFMGTALAAFGSATGGLPSTVVAPSLLFDDLEVRGPRGEAPRLPLVPAPPLD